MRGAERRGCQGVPRAFFVVLLALMLGAASESANADRPSPDQVEAAYLYNFGKFVRWPSGTGHGPLHICVAAESSFEQTVERLIAGEQIDGRKLDMRTVGPADGIMGCSILFVGSAQESRIDEFLGAATGKPILTVGDGPDFLAHGGILQFVMVEDHVRFAVNLNAANRSGLGLSSELLKVAVSVIGRSGKGGAR